MSRDELILEMVSYIGKINKLEALTFLNIYEKTLIDEQQEIKTAIKTVNNRYSRKEAPGLIYSHGTWMTPEEDARVCDEVDAIMQDTEQ